MSSTVRKMSVTGETGSYIFILTVSKMPNIYIVWDKMEFKLFGLMWVSYRPASIRVRAVLSLDRVAGVSRTGIKQPPMHYCARFFFSLFSQSLLWLAEPLSDTTPAGSEPFGMFLLTMILVYIHCISYREQNRCKTFSDKIALIFTKIFSRARGRTPALSVSFQLFWSWRRFLIWRLWNSAVFLLSVKHSHFGTKLPTVPGNTQWRILFFQKTERALRQAQRTKTINII